MRLAEIDVDPRQRAVGPDVADRVGPGGIVERPRLDVDPLRRASGSFQILVPHSVQPSMRTRRPLSADFSNATSWPEMSSTSPAFMIIVMENAAPDDRWQSLQWHA